MIYSIGEVSAMLNLSRDMIRYYEKVGAVKSTRNADNNYRSYDSMEFFWLLECMQHKSWGIPIGEIAGIRENSFSANTAEFLDREIARLEDSAYYENLLAERLAKVRDNAALGRINIGNFWVRNIPPRWKRHLVTGHGDEYDRITLTQDASQFLFSDDLLPFFDNMIRVQGGDAHWEMGVEERYLRKLGKTAPEDFEHMPATRALCTNVDIGEIGQFDPEVFQVLPAYASDHGYKIPEDAFIQGQLLGRGYEDGKFCRVVQIYLPIL